jgi:hypothetical protein
VICIGLRILILMSTPCGGDGVIIDVKFSHGIALNHLHALESSRFFETRSLEDSQFYSWFGLSRDEFRKAVSPSMQVHRYHRRWSIRIGGCKVRISIFNVQNKSDVFPDSLKQKVASIT